MARKTFSQVLNEYEFDCYAEYKRIHELFYETKVEGDTLYGLCAKNFINFPKRGTCISIIDFNRIKGFDFNHIPRKLNNSDVDFLITFCDYAYNLVIFCANGSFGIGLSGYFIQHILILIEKIGYTSINDGLITEFVPKKPEAIIASESVDDSNISYDILHYNHHSMKGNLKEKRKLLFSFANHLEPKEKYLKSFNYDFGNNLFCMFNEFSIRHEKEKKNALLAEATDEKLEEYYDLTYELCLTAFSILAGMESNEKVKEIRKKINK